MKNWKMWLYAIVSNAILIGLNSVGIQNSVDEKWNLGFMVLSIGLLNFVIGLGITSYSDSNKSEMKGMPFSLLAILMALIGMGICTYK
jgi:hypothetical protein